MHCFAVTHMSPPLGHSQQTASHGNSGEPVCFSQFARRASHDCPVLPDGQSCALQYALHSPAWAPVNPAQLSGLWAVAVAAMAATMTAVAPTATADRNRRTERSIRPP